MSERKQPLTLTGSIYQAFTDRGVYMDLQEVINPHRNDEDSGSGLINFRQYLLPNSSRGIPDELYAFAQEATTCVYIPHRNRSIQTRTITASFVPSSTSPGYYDEQHFGIGIRADGSRLVLDYLVQFLNHHPNDRNQIIAEGFAHMRAGNITNEFFNILFHKDKKAPPDWLDPHCRWSRNIVGSTLARSIAVLTYFEHDMDALKFLANDAAKIVALPE